MVLPLVSIAEILHRMIAELSPLEESEFLSVKQQEHLERARGDIEAAVDDWMRDAMRTKRALRGKLFKVSEEGQVQVEEHPPVAGLEPLLDMLAVYHDDMNQEGYSHRHQQRIMIAIHNLLEVVRELEVQVH